MASLPSQHPHLALHLTDRALTPLISSSSSPAPTSSAPSQQHPFSSKSKPRQQQSPPPPRQRQRPTFSTSPLSPTSSSNDGADSDNSHPSSSENGPASSQQPLPPDEKSQALAHLTSTALASYDTAKRLSKGAPLRTMVEYGGTGPVVLHSYMCPMSLALGVPGRKSSHDSLHTGAGVVDEGPADNSSTGGGGGQGIAIPGGDSNDNDEAALLPTTTTTTTTFATTTNKFSTLTMHRNHPSSPSSSSSGQGDHQEDSPNAPPMLIGTVVAPRAEDLRDARRAAGRLETVARVFQAEWVADGIEGPQGTTGSAGDGVGTGT